MNSIIDDDMLDRLVSYEKYVTQYFVRIARRRWVDVSVEAMEEYEQAKKFKSYISTMVDLAFRRYGIETGLMKSPSLHLDPALGKDLESLVAQLRSASQRFHPPLRQRQFSLVV